ncbi:hypothetical protein HDU87_001468 [Geranomyces variabilis]|uniref:Uncharacterized protein n=1 Tax=Geranomyces variabilis TaxID=109894 RepID=A0AAD5TGR8_9FUNG|nr:hypothetical protein HDU87_001468 [Geranomyces variabilis]
MTAVAGPTYNYTIGTTQPPRLDAKCPLRPLRKDSSPPFNYDARSDPALRNWFARSGVRKLVLPTEASFAGQSVQTSKIRFHDHAPPPPPPTLASSLISTAILHSSLSRHTLAPLETLLLATAHFSDIRSFDLAEPLPAPAELSKFQSILLIGDLLKPNSPHALLQRSAPAWHRVLKDYIAANRPAMVITPSTFDSPLTPIAVNRSVCPGLGQIPAPDHPMLAGVERLGLEDAVWTVKGHVEKGAQIIARWGTGVPLIVVRGSVVAINMIVVPKFEGRSNQLIDVWDPAQTDALTLISNALRWSASASKADRASPKCPSCANPARRAKSEDLTHRTVQEIEREHRDELRRRHEAQMHDTVWAQYKAARYAKEHAPSRPHTHDCSTEHQRTGGTSGSKGESGWLPRIASDSPYRRKEPVRQAKSKTHTLPRFAERKLNKPPSQPSLFAPLPDTPSRRSRPEGAGKGSRRPIVSTTHGDSDPESDQAIGAMAASAEAGEREGATIVKRDESPEGGLVEGATFVTVPVSLTEGPLDVAGQEQ